MPFIMRPRTPAEQRWLCGADDPALLLVGPAAPRARPQARPDEDAQQENLTLKREVPFTAINASLASRAAALLPVRTFACIGFSRTGYKGLTATACRCSAVMNLTSPSGIVVMVYFWCFGCRCNWCHAGDSGDTG